MLSVNCFKDDVKYLKSIYKDVLTRKIVPGSHPNHIYYIVVEVTLMTTISRRPVILWRVAAGTCAV